MRYRACRRQFRNRSQQALRRYAIHLVTLQGSRQMNRWHSPMAPRAIRVRKSVLATASFRRIMAAALLIPPLLAAAGTWQTLNNPPPLPDIFDPNGVDQYAGGAGFPLLLTDGGVMVQNIGDGKIFKLTPDLKGSYVNGTWSQLATMPYVSYAGAQAV